VASRGVKVWAWCCVIALAAFAWTGFVLKILPDWLFLAGVPIVFFCLVRLYRALGDDVILSEPSRDMLRRHVLMFGPAGALEALLVSYGLQKTPTA
jgi:hypothetical protein